MKKLYTPLQSFIHSHFRTINYFIPMKKQLKNIAAGFLICTAAHQLISTSSFAQGVGVGTLSPHASAKLHLESTTQGFLVPRMTQAQRDAIAAPVADGLMIYQSDGDKGFWHYDGAVWKKIASGAAAGIPLWNRSAEHIYPANINDSVGIGTATPGAALEIRGNGTLLKFREAASSGFRGEISNVGGFATLNLADGAQNTTVFLSTFGNSYFKGGNVGIGTATPTAKLHINQTDNTDAFNAVTSGYGSAGIFDITNSDNNVSVINAHTMGGGTVIRAIQSSAGGSGKAGHFEIESSGNSGAAIFATTYGSGSAGIFQTTNASSVANAVEVTNNGGGAAIRAIQSGVSGNGNGNAGYFEVNNAGNLSSAVSATNNGAGSAGEFKIFNAGNPAAALYATTTGTGYAGHFDGKLRTTTFQMTNGAANGYFLQSDGSGNATWVAPGTGGMRWDQLTNPTAPLTLAHGTNLTTFDWTNNTTNAFTMTANSLTTGSLLSLVSTNAATTGNLLYIQSNSTSAVTNGLARFNFSPHTGNGVQVDDATATGNAVAINTPTLTSGKALSVISTNTLTTGNVFYVQSGSTSAAAAGLARFNFGAHTGNGVQIDDQTTTGNAMAINANSLSSGKGLAIASTSAGLSAAGVLYDVTLSGNNAANAGTVFRAASTGAANTGTVGMFSNAGTGLSLRVNDDGTDTDASPFAIDNAGNVGIGTSGPAAKLDVNPGPTYNGVVANIQNSNASNGNMLLSLSNNGNGNAINVSATGFGRAAQFSINSNTSATDAVGINTDGQNSKALNIAHTGTNGNTSNVGVYSTVSGARAAGSTNVGGYFSATGATNNYAGIFDQGFVGIGTTTPTNKLDVLNAGTAGRAGNFTISNAANGSYALYATTNGTNHSMVSYNTGTTGEAGHFEVQNASNGANAIMGYTNGTGRAGQFQIANAGNSADALYATTNGTGNAGNFNGKVKITDGTQGTDKVFTSDINGVGSWQTLSGTLSGGTINYIPKWTSATSLSSTSNLYDDGTNVGVGNPTPAYKLDVQGNLMMNNYDIYVKDPAHGIGYYGPGKLFAATSIDGPVTYGWGGGALGTKNGADKIALSWNAAGNVGIGTASPLYRLDIQGGNAMMNDNDIYLHDPAHGIGYYGPAKQFAATSIDGPVTYGWGGGALGTKNGADKIALYWNAAGNVGIGTATPGTKLHVSGNSTLQGEVGINSGPLAGRILYLGNNTVLNEPQMRLDYGSGSSAIEILGNAASEQRIWFGTGGSPTMGSILYDNSNNSLRFGTNNTANRMVIDNAGNVGIGTTAPLIKLDVLGGANIWAGTRYAVPNNYMADGSLTLGNRDANFGGGAAGWTTNSAGLLMECMDNTEIAVHDNGARVASIAYYEGASNRINIGRDMGWGTISTISLNGNVGIGITPVAKLDILNANNNDAFSSVTSGFGRAGNFYINNGGNGSDALYVRTTGSGNGLYSEYVGGGAGNAVYGWTNSTGGRAGYFQIQQAASSADALYATTDGTGKVLNVSNTYAAATVGNRYGVYSTSTGLNGGTNIGGYFSAQNGVANYAAIFDQGNVGIGLNAPVAKLHVKSTGNGALYGFGVQNSDNNYTLVVRDDKRVGVNETLPAASLDVKGEGNTSATYGFGVKNSDGLYTLLVRDDNKVGVGTVPSAKLHVFENAATAATQVDQSGTGNALTVNQTNGAAGTHYGVYSTTTGSGAGTTNVAGYFTASSGTNNYAAIFDQGNVGIGTAAPIKDLSFGGNAARTIWMERHTTVNTAGNSLLIQSGGATVSATDKKGGELQLSSGIATGTGGSYISFWSANKSGASNIVDSVPKERFRMDQGHLVSIQQEIPTVGNGTQSSGAVVSVSPLPKSTDAAGHITFTNTAVVGSKAVITFKKTYTTIPVVVITVHEGTFAAAFPYISAVSATGFTVSTNGAGTASAIYHFSYHVIGTQ